MSRTGLRNLLDQWRWLSRRCRGLGSPGRELLVTLRGMPEGN
ncbi:hypothetical protein ACFOZ0_11950 [Streptomyces yaanensis]|uniref:Uncharacterized protein n=1 Tax=Streptomyces yaanensis TaxID=1142239 RepID=A0ABV7SCV7_9ACTN|nr:hypothetical protein [Streptomyces sp. CGMCC 4.7035]WNB99158.1 hypothetical protein Q2K21_14345 [Streptomyces sp. CGMCC 4.7035]